MADVNFIKPQLESWRKCKDWINNVYPEKKFELDFELTKIKAISYEERLGGSGQEESMRRSIINDKLNALENKKKKCEGTIRFCEEIIEQVRPQYREVFRYRYESYATISWIVYKTNYSRRRIYEILDEESERLSNE